MVCVDGSKMTAAVYAVMPFVLVLVAALSLAERLTAKVHLEPDVSELKIRMGRLERLMARVLNAVDKPLSLTSDAATQTHPQVKTEGYRHRQKSAPENTPATSHENLPATSVRTRSWESSVSQARMTQHNTSQKPPSRASSFESINSSFSLDSKAWNSQTRQGVTRIPARS